MPHNDTIQLWFHGVLSLIVEIQQERKQDHMQT